MSRIIAVANQKGGVGKTTTSINLAASLAVTKRRVLLIDLDAQGNATMGVGVNKRELEYSVCDVLLGENPIEKCTISLDEPKIDLLPSNSDTTAAEVELKDVVLRELRLKNALESVKDNYDFIIIDCPPALSMLTVNALVAADGILVPMQCEYYALEGLSDLMRTVEQIRGIINPNLKIEGVLRTMYDPRSNLTTDVSAQLTEHFGDQVYSTIIPRNIRLAEAPSHGLPAILYDPGSRGAQAYLALAGEVLRRQGRMAA